MVEEPWVHDYHGVGPSMGIVQIAMAMAMAMVSIRACNRVPNCKSATWSNREIRHGGAAITVHMGNSRAAYTAISGGDGWRRGNSSSDGRIRATAAGNHHHLCI